MRRAGGGEGQTDTGRGTELAAVAEMLFVQYTSFLTSTSEGLSTRFQGQALPKLNVTQVLRGEGRGWLRGLFVVVVAVVVAVATFVKLSSIAMSLAWL